MYYPANASGGLTPATLTEFQHLSAKLRGLDDQLADITASVSSSSSSRTVGEIVVWLTAAAPTGWRLLNGDAISRTDYVTLFELWGTAHGPGDGLTTFNIPDFRGKFPLGKAATGTGSTLGSTGGEIDHRHEHPGGTTAVNTGSVAVQSGVGTTVASDGHTHQYADEETDANNPPFIAVNFIVYTRVA